MPTTVYKRGTYDRVFRRRYAARAAAARKRGRTGYANIVRVGAKRARLEKRVENLYQMIETKECQRRVLAVNLPHNNVSVLAINPFILANGTGDPENLDTGNRIGDAINVKGMAIKAFLQNQDQRAKVFYRVMLIRCAKGDTPTRATLFKQSADCKIIDQISTERYSIVAQRMFNVTASNNVASAVTAITGVPNAGTPAGIATKVLKMWIPGRKFGRNGYVRYEPSSTTQVKFYDYKIVVLAYDWYQTAQDVNNVGFVNELYTKMYFKDA